MQVRWDHRWQYLKRLMVGDEIVGEVARTNNVWFARVAPQLSAEGEKFSTVREAMQYVEALCLQST